MGPADPPNTANAYLTSHLAIPAVLRMFSKRDALPMRFMCFDTQFGICQMVDRLILDLGWRQFFQTYKALLSSDSARNSEVRPVRRGSPAQWGLRRRALCSARNIV